MEEGLAPALGRAGCRASPPGWWSSGSGAAWPSASAGYWDVEGTFEAKGVTFGATLTSVDGKRLATGKDFEATTGQLSAAAAGAVALLDEAAARGLVERLGGVDHSVASVESRDWKQSPHPPFMTSTLQQEAGRKLRFGAERTMRLAQKLYEAGYITYMRTDSDLAVGAGRRRRPVRDRRALRRRLPPRQGPGVLPQGEERPGGPRGHPPRRRPLPPPGGGRPGGRLRRRPPLRPHLEALRGVPDGRRPGPAGLACSSARPPPPARPCSFSASGKTITFPGFLRAYVEGSDDPEAELEDREVRLPTLEQGEAVANEALEAAGHATQPPARYTEASLVAELEARGIGRPSTYASVIQTIQDRGYVWKKGSALVPSWTAFAVIRLLEQHFAHLVDYDFTARMEESLDDIARGERESVPWLRQFYFGNGVVGLRTLVEQRVPEIDAREINTIPIGVDAEGREIVVRVGRYGPYLSRGDRRRPFPTGSPPTSSPPRWPTSCSRRARRRAGCSAPTR